MKTNRRKLLLLLPVLWPILWANPANAGVNCGGVPHTRLELAICGEPVLRALDSELSAAFKDARRRGLIDARAIAKHRNKVARQCRRESSDAFSSCLMHAELGSLEWVSNKLGGSTVIARSGGNRSWRYDASPAARARLLKRQLAVAEHRLRSTADPDLTVVTLLELISVYKQHPPQRGQTKTLVSQLERKLASGCDHVVYGRDWQTALKANNLSCKDLRPAALFSSADF